MTTAAEQAKAAMFARPTAGQKVIDVVPSRLGSVKKGKIATPATFLFYGPEGVGKTTLAASAPDVVFMDIEDGSSELSVARYPFHPEDPLRGHVPRTYQDVLDGIEDLTVNAHAFKTLALDSVDRLESLIHQHITARDSQKSAKNQKGDELKSIEDYGYGKGYTIAVEEWRSFCTKLDRLRYAKRMQIVLIGHGQVKAFKNPEGEDFDRWQLRMDPRSAAFLKEWAKVTGFLTLEQRAEKLTKNGRAKGISTNMRILKLARSAAIDAKSRLALPAEVEVDIDDPWAPLAAAVVEADKVDAASLMKDILAEIERVGGEPNRFDRAVAACKDAVAHEDAGKLQRFLNELKKLPTKEEVQS